MTDRSEKLRLVQELTCKLLDHELNADETRQLEALLFGDPEACELYLNITTLDAHLARELTGQAPPVVDVPSCDLPSAPTQASRSRSFWRQVGNWRQASNWRIGRLSVAAMVLLSASVAFLRLPTSATAPAAVACATLIEARDAEWGGGGPTHHVGDRIEPSILVLNKGIAVFRFDGGAMATLTGPAEFQLENRKTAELKSGKVLVRAEHDTAGFTLRTAASDYVDLGTEFGVLINDDASSEIHVFEGVVIARPRGNDLVVPVLRNEAGRVEPERGDLVAIEANAGKFPGVTTVPLARVIPAVDLVPVSLNTSSGNRPVAAPKSDLPAYPPLPANARVVFLGDRATDCETHILLLAQTLRQLYGPFNHPKLFNAGVSVPLAFQDFDLDRFVLRFKPTHAVLEYGPELAAGPRRLSAGEFGADIRRLVNRLLDAKIEPILATGFKLGEHHSPCQKLLDEYNGVVRAVAKEKGLRLADVDQRFRSLDACKLSLVAASGTLPTFGGYQQVASALLPAFGHPNQHANSSLRLSLLPGAVTQWKYRVKPFNDRLTDAQAAALEPDTSWSELVLPQPDDKFLARMADSTHSATYRDRERGVATGLCRSHDQTVEAVAYVDSCETRPAFLNVGACVRAVWLNDRKIYTSPTRWNGWHPGKERFDVTLRQGTNKVVVESGGSLFISVTDEVDWAVE